MPRVNPPTGDKLETRTFSTAEVRFVDGADGQPPRLEGYAAVFNAPSEDLGGFREIVLPGAFKRTLEAKADVRLLVNHDGLPLARSTSGTLNLSEDSRGLKFSAILDANDPDVRALMPKMKRGDVNQCSFAFNTRSDNWKSSGGATTRELADVDLSDVSVVTFPAYPQTSVAMRSLREWRKKAPPEQRAVIQYEDNSLVYYCRYAVQSARDAFDQLNNVLDICARIEGELSGQDTEAAEDLVSTLVDLIAKAKRAKATLEALGAEDETEADADGAGDDDAAARSTNDTEKALLALAEAD